MPAEPRYTREELAAACAESRTTSEIGTRLGRVPTPGRNAYVRGLLKEFGIDHGHLDTTNRVYSRELLTEAVAASDSFNDVLRCLDIPVTGGSATHINKQIRRFGIDTSHFTGNNGKGRNAPAYGVAAVLAAAEGAASVAEVAERLGFGTSRSGCARVRRMLAKVGVTTFQRGQRGQPNTGRKFATISEAEFTAAVAASASVVKCARLLDTKSGANFYTFFRTAVEALSLDTSHMTGQGHNRGQVSSRRIPASEFLVWNPNVKARPEAHRLRRALIEIGVPYVCAGCGTGPEWSGHAMTLEIDHINGDFTDNRPENLKVLCPNCHAITATFCRRKSALPTQRSAGSLGSAATPHDDSGSRDIPE